MQPGSVNDTGARQAPGLRTDFPDYTISSEIPHDRVRCPVPERAQCMPSPRPPVLLEAQVIRRVTLLAELQNALTAQGCSSVLIRNHRLVLRSDGRHMDPSGPTDPQLCFFVSDGMSMATTDGTAYYFADGQTHPAHDPHGAATSARTDCTMTAHISRRQPVPAARQRVTES
jgi:hypothetical protein